MVLNRTNKKEHYMTAKATNKPIPQPITMQDALQSIVPVINDAIHEWLQRQNPEDIRKKVFATLEAARDEVAPKLMGFNKNSFGGGWEIDHCNGRAGESSIGDYMKKHQAEGIQQFIDQLELTKLRPFTATEIRDLQSEYRSLVISRTREAVRARAAMDATRLVNQLSVDDLVSAIKKTQQLIGAGYEIPVTDTN